MDWQTNQADYFFQGVTHLRQKSGRNDKEILIKHASFTQYTANATAMDLYSSVHTSFSVSLPLFSFLYFSVSEPLKTNLINSNMLGISTSN